MVQRIEGFRFHSGGRRIEGRLRARIGGGEGRPRHPERGPEGRIRAGRGQERQDVSREHKGVVMAFDRRDRKSTRLNSSHPSISYAVFCLKKKKKNKTTNKSKKKNKKKKKQTT